MYQYNINNKYNDIHVFNTIYSINNKYNMYQSPVQSSHLCCIATLFWMSMEVTICSSLPDKELKLSLNFTIVNLTSSESRNWVRPEDTRRLGLLQDVFFSDVPPEQMSTNPDKKKTIQISPENLHDLRSPQRQRGLSLVYTSGQVWQ